MCTGQSWLVPRSIPVAPANDLLKIEIRPSSSCDDCNLWHHISCVGISTSTYHSLVNQTALWFCKHCGIPNFTPSFSSDEHPISHTDSYEHNNGILYDNDNEQPIFGPNPQNASAPERQKSTQGNPLKGILINTNSVKSIEKATQLKATIHYSNPDIIFLVETKLDNNYTKHTHFSHQTTKPSEKTEMPTEVAYS